MFGITQNATDEEIRQALKSLGFSHFQNGVSAGRIKGKHTQLITLVGTNIKRGLKIEIEWINCKERGIYSISFLRRVKVSGDQTCYLKLCGFRMRDNGTWNLVLQHDHSAGLKNENNLSWGGVLHRANKIAQTIEGHPTIPKSKKDGILQNLIMADLKEKLHKAGYTRVVFVYKATTSEEASELSLRANGMFYSIVLKLKSGELAIEFGNIPTKRIPIPCFEDPSFDHDKFFPAAVVAIHEIQELRTQHLLSTGAVFDAFKNVR